MLHHLLNILRPIIKGQHGRKNNRSHLGQFHHIPQVNRVKGRLPCHKHQFSTLLQRHIRRPQQQIIRIPAVNSRHSLHTAGNHHHSLRLKRSAGNRRSDIMKIIDKIKVPVRPNRHYQRWGRVMPSASSYRFRLDGRNNPKLKKIGSVLMTAFP